MSPDDFGHWLLQGLVVLCLGVIGWFLRQTATEIGRTRSDVARMRRRFVAFAAAQHMFNLFAARKMEIPYDDTPFHVDDDDN